MCNIYGAAPSVTNCTFTNNLASGAAAMDCHYWSPARIRNCLFADNFSESNWAGALTISIQCGSAESPTEVTDCVFLDNHSGYVGGAVYVYSNSYAHFTNWSILDGGSWARHIPAGPDLNAV